VLLTSLSQGEFLVNNYKQAINILNGEAVFIKQMHDQNIADVSVFQDWLAEEKVYLEGLSREPLQESLTMEYWQKLVNLGASEYVILFRPCVLALTSISRRRLSTAESTWVVLTPASIMNTRDTTQSQETDRRHAQENAARDLLVVQNLEVRMGILCRWGPNDDEWKEAATMVGRRRYQRCLDALEGLIVARMFELTKMNMSQTGASLICH
jgi:hypothetical protein